MLHTDICQNHFLVRTKLFNRAIFISVECPHLSSSNFEEVRTNRMFESSSSWRYDCYLADVSSKGVELRKKKELCEMVGFPATIFIFT